MSYEVIFHPGALKEFDKLPKTVQQRLGEVIDTLQQEPRPSGAVKLTGIDAYRLRVGSYRIAYGIRDERLIVLIVKVAHRSNIYRDIEAIKQRLK